MAVHLADWGLRVQTDDEARRRDAVLIRIGRLWRTGWQPVLPPVAGRRP